MPLALPPLRPDPQEEADRAIVDRVYPIMREISNQLEERQEQRRQRGRTTREALAEPRVSAPRTQSLPRTRVIGPSTSREPTRTPLLGATAAPGRDHPLHIAPIYVSEASATRASQVDHERQRLLGEQLLAFNEEFPGHFPYPSLTQVIEMMDRMDIRLGTGWDEAAPRPSFLGREGQGPTLVDYVQLEAFVNRQRDEMRDLQARIRRLTIQQDARLEVASMQVRLAQEASLRREE